MSDELYKPFEPDWTVPPGESLAELLGESGISLPDLSSRVRSAGSPDITDAEVLALLEAVIAARMPVTADLAARLERAVPGWPSAQFWLRWEALYQGDLVRLGRAVQACARCCAVLEADGDGRFCSAAPGGPAYECGTGTGMQPHDVTVRDREVMAAPEESR
jgi:plasmid maintenance system antidote protein VapI